MNNILITGITGFLGRHLTRTINGNIVGIGHSQQKIAEFQRQFPNVSIYCTELDDTLEDIIIRHNIEYIIHCAAVKYIEFGEQYPMNTVRTNIISTDKIIQLANKHKLKNVIAVSTDKANSPSCIYGMSKHIMERIVLMNNYTVFQGVNFFWSDGSVFDIWYKQYMRKQPLTVTNIDHIRYFSFIDDVCRYIIDNLDSSGMVCLPNTVYEISLRQCLDVFCKHFDYHNVRVVGNKPYEKTIETISENIKVVTITDENLEHQIEKITSFL
jgi:FlaA1/EpsC-like NDP-sugar epimerase